MWPISVNKKLIPMKMHYFLYSGCIATILSFGSTYAKQLGYSKIAVGYIMMCLFFISMLTKPAIGAIVDKFRVKKLILLAFICSTGVSAYLLMFVPELPLEAFADLVCNANTMSIGILHPGDGKQLSYCDKKRLMGNNGERLVNCKLYCQHNDSLFSEMFMSLNGTTYQTFQNELSRNTSDISKIENQNNNLTVFVYLNNITTEPNGGMYNFQVKYADMNYNRFTWPTCHQPTKVPCRLNCHSQTIMELATVSKTQDIFFMPEFWEFFLLLCLFWFSQSGIWTIQDPICFDLLEDKHSDFGKQRCWTSIGWGTVSMLSGWLVDYFSNDEVHKNYTPVSYLILFFMALNLMFASNIEVTTVIEFKPSKNTFQNVIKLFAKPRVVSFFIWILSLGIYSSMSLSYLFWYLEELASEHECRQMPWIKTLQGLSQGFQSFGGEVPIFFCSGWIINKIGHKHSMSLVLLTFTIRFFFYSIITNPVWVLALETLNGMMYALGRAVVVSYSRMISPPSTNHTVLGLVGLFDCIGLSMGGVLAAHIFEIYGGVWLFRSFTYGSAVMCVSLIVYNFFDKVK